MRTNFVTPRYIRGNDDVTFLVRMFQAAEGWQ
jgi:hypothetical protein